MKRRVSNSNNARRTATHIATKYVITTMFDLLFVWCPCMAINVSVQYNGGLLPGIILSPQCYFHRGTRLNAMKRFCICSLRSLNVLTFFPLTGGCSEGLLPIHSGHQVRWTYQPGSHRIFIHLPSAVRALTFLARRIQPFLSLVDREVEFCVLMI